MFDFEKTGIIARVRIHGYPLAMPDLRRSKLVLDNFASLPPKTHFLLSLVVDTRLPFFPTVGLFELQSLLTTKKKSHLAFSCLQIVMKLNEKFFEFNLANGQICSTQVIG